MALSNTKQLFSVEAAQSKKMELVDSVTLRGIKSLRSATSHCISASGHTHESIADHKDVRKRKEQISKFITGSSGLKGDDIENIINASGNLAIVQYLANKYGYVIVDAKAYEAMKSSFIQSLENAA